MDIQCIDPTEDERWKQFLQTHPGASVFHTPAWLNALRATYGYQPVVVTTSAPNQPITNGIPLCRIQSWITGSRIVSLPFSDHCQPLFDCAEFGAGLARSLPKLLEHEHCDYVELRPLTSELEWLIQDGFAQSASFVHHTLDLKPSASVLFSRLHKSCFQRKIRRAEKEDLAYEEGTADALLHQFYSLLVSTRRRHGVPPQPLAWFRNLRTFFGKALKIAVASKDRKPVASIITLRYKDTLVYKYGCSDAVFHRFGAMPFLFWETIQRGKAEGATEFDLGRSDTRQTGLVAFKEHLNATAAPLNYYRFPARAARRSAFMELMWRPEISAVSTHLPTVLLKAASKLFYRHLA
jgi:CelD/BcsL family acetyltransferase involved in cellulose biosynthesis